MRELNPNAKIMVNAEKLSDIEPLYANGASYISAPRLLEAKELLAAIDAARVNLLGEKQQKQRTGVAERDEVIP